MSSGGSVARMENSKAMGLGLGIGRHIPNEERKRLKKSMRIKMFKKLVGMIISRMVGEIEGRERKKGWK
jgi:hypothetical protein